MSVWAKSGPLSGAGEVRKRKGSDPASGACALFDVAWSGRVAVPGVGVVAAPTEWAPVPSKRA